MQTEKPARAERNHDKRPHTAPKPRAEPETPLEKDENGVLKKVPEPDQKAHDGTSCAPAFLLRVWSWLGNGCRSVAAEIASLEATVAKADNRLVRPPMIYSPLHTRPVQRFESDEAWGAGMGPADSLASDARAEGDQDDFR